MSNKQRIIIKSKAVVFPRVFYIRHFLHIIFVFHWSPVKYEDMVEEMVKFESIYSVCIYILYTYCIYNIYIHM